MQQPQGRVSRPGQHIQHRGLQNNQQNNAFDNTYYQNNNFDNNYNVQPNNNNNFDNNNYNNNYNNGPLVQNGPQQRFAPQSGASQQHFASQSGASQQRFVGASQPQQRFTSQSGASQQQHRFASQSGASQPQKRFTSHSESNAQQHMSQNDNHSNGSRNKFNGRGRGRGRYQNQFVHQNNEQGNCKLLFSHFTIILTLFQVAVLRPGPLVSGPPPTKTARDFATDFLHQQIFHRPGFKHIILESIRMFARIDVMDDDISEYESELDCIEALSKLWLVDEAFVSIRHDLDTPPTGSRYVKPSAQILMFTVTRDSITQMSSSEVSKMVQIDPFWKSDMEKYKLVF